MENNLKHKSFSKKLFKWLKRVVLIFLVFLVILSITLTIVFNTESFRRSFIAEITKLINNELIGKVEIEDLYFINLNKIKVKGFRLLAAGDTVASANEVIVDIYYEPLLSSKIKLNELTLNSPNIKLLRSRIDSNWNINKIAKPAAASEPSKSSLIIDINKIRLRNAQFTMIDSLANDYPVGMFNPTRMRFRDINLEMRAIARIGENKFFAKINKLVLRDETSGIIVNDLSMVAELSPGTIEAKNAKISTSEGNVEFNAKMSNFNIFGKSHEMAIENVWFNADFIAKDFNMSMIYHFAPLPIKMVGEKDVKAGFEGTLNNMKINWLEVAWNDTEITGEGYISDILKGKPKYKMKLDGSEASWLDLVGLMPEMKLGMAVPNFKTASFKKLFVDGSIDSVFTDFDFNSAIGDAKGVAGVGFGGGRLCYSGDLSTEKINLSPIVRNTDMQSSFNSTMKFVGSGYNLNNLKVDLNLHTYDSKISKYNVKSGDLSIKLRALDTLVIDTCKFVINRHNKVEETEVFNEDFSTLKVVGGIGLKNLKNPAYDVLIETQALDIEYITNNKLMPQHLSAKFDISGQGINLDSMQLDLKSSFQEVLFGDKAMMPFDFMAKIEGDNLSRSINVKSDFINLSMLGKYSVNKLIESMTNQGLYLADFINQKISLVKPQISEKPYVSNIKIPKNPHFPEVDCDFNLEINDFSPVSNLIENFNLLFSGRIEGKLSSNANESFFVLDTVDIDNIQYKLGQMRLKSEAISMSGVMNIQLQDSLPQFSYVKMNMLSKGNFNINDMQLNKPGGTLNFDGNQLDFNVASGFNNIFDVATNGKMILTKENIDINIDSSRFVYNKKIAWEISTPILASIGKQGIIIKQFRIGRMGSERISLEGVFDDRTARGIKLNLYDFKLNDIAMFVPAANAKQLLNLSGNLDSLTISIDGNLSMPLIYGDMNISDLAWAGNKVGNFSAIFKHENANISSYAQLYNPKISNKDKMLDISVNSFPMYLGTDSVKSRIRSDIPMDIMVKGKEFPVKLISPFVPNVSELNGAADLNLVISGFAPDNFQYSGNIKVNNGYFVLNNTNIPYTVAGEIGIETGKISLNKVKLKNLPNQLPDGAADISGEIKLDKFELKNIDISIKSNRLLVMNDETAAAMPNLYGTFIIGTEARPLRFHGTLTAPELDGDIVVWNAELKMPKSNVRQFTKTTFKYEVKGKTKRYYVTTNTDSILASQQQAKTNGTNFADLINYDLNIKMKSFSVIIDLGNLMEVYAKVGNKDQSQPLRYVKYRNVNAAKLYGGELELKEGSTLKVFRIMNTKGSISFPTGKIDNPQLNIEASYDGKFIEGNITTNYTVKVFVSGMKERPELKLTYYLNGIEQGGDAKKVEEDAFYLLTTGKPKRDQGIGSNSNILGEGLNMGISQVASKSLTELLLGTGVIQSADVTFKGEGIETAQVNLTGSLFGVANWTIGGTVGDLSSNNEIIIDVPISVQSKAFNNFILQLTKSTNLNVSTQMQDSKDFEFKIKFGGSW